MDTKKYAVFVKTVELSSLTKAAEELGLTQSGVSHIIAALESDLGLTLLRRTRTGAHLTADGERLLPIIREIVRQDERLHREAAELTDLVAGPIRLGTFTSVATHWLPAMMMQFEQEHPQVEFRLFNGDYHDVDQWLADGSVELGFVTLPTELKCECIPLYEDELEAIFPVGHPLAAQERCRVEDVAREPFISLLKSSDHDARRALESVGVRPNVRLHSKDDYAVIAMVRQGLGVSIMPLLLLRGNSSGVEARPIVPPSSRTIALAVRDEAGPAARRFAAFAAGWVRRWADENKASPSEG